jgi:NUMOD4 motif/HNH endonuclease
MNFNEYWAEIEDFPNYQISNYGQVQNIRTGRYLRLSKNNSGYLSVTLYNEKGPDSTFVHHLVVDAFLRTNRTGLEVNHIDGYKTNNYFGNLEIVTKSENTYHAIRNNLRTPHPHSKRIRIIETDEIFENEVSCARHIGAAQGNLSAVLHGRRKSLKGYHFEFVD